MSFLGEIKRRKVFQVAAVYLVVAWLIMQVVDVVADPLLLPDWFSRVVIILLAIGFPLALILSWAFDVTPSGVVRDGVTRRGSGKRIEYVLISLLAVAVIWLGYRVEIAPPETTEIQENQEQQEVLANSVAVLPFENMSADPDDAFFSAALHDEVLNQLAKLQSLNVIARTSVLQYAGATQPITDIARELNVGAVMEGSVSYAQGRVAVRAQLIDASTGFHLWSDSYNRELADVFDIQIDIAMNIANALEAEYSLEEQAAIERQPTSSPEAYALYLRARDLWLTAVDNDSILAMLEQAIALDPNFAQAHAFIGRIHAPGAFGGDKQREALALASIERALELDPALADAHGVMGAIHEANRRWEDARREYETAYRLNPLNDVQLFYLRFSRLIGDYEAAVQMGERVVQLDPNNINGHNQLTVSYRFVQDFEAAVESAEKAISLSPGNVVTRPGLAIAQILLGNHEAGIRELQTYEELGGNLNGLRIGQFALAYSLADQPSEVERMYRLAEAQGGSLRAIVWAMVHLATGENELALQRLQLAVDLASPADNQLLAEIKANPWGLEVLESPDFAELRQRIGAFR